MRASQRMTPSSSYATKWGDNATRRGEGARSHRSPGLILSLLLLIAGSLFFSTTAAAAAPNLLLRMPDGKTAPGSGAGELFLPGSVAANPDTGRVYVSESGNNRISEYTAWGAFVKAWGWDVAPEGAPGDTPTDQLEICTAICKEGTWGEGAGQGGFYNDIEVDANGDVFAQQHVVVSGEFEQRVQKFSPEGELLLTLGGEVNKTTGANVCTKADIEGGDVCGAPVPGTGPGEFSASFSAMTYNKGTDTIFVGDEDRIQEFNLDGTFKAQISFEGALDAFDGKTVRALASDEDGNLYLGLESIEDVYKLSSSGAPLAPGEPGKSKLKVKWPTSLAVDGAGVVYVADGGRYVLGFDSAGGPIDGMEAGDEFAKSEIQANVADLKDLAVNQCPGSEGPNLYAVRSNPGGSVWNYVSAYGAPPIGCEDPPLNPPVVLDQYAAAVSRDDAILKGEINPRFWADTKYHVQYGAGKCTEGGCGQTTPEAVLIDNVTNSAVTTAGVILSGLEPGTTYHYRFVAKSTGGGPVIGEERTFTTFAAASPPQPCPNDELRAGPAAGLPDCRAYEMVSPLDKGNGDAALWEGRNGNPPKEFELHQSSLSGERFTYSSWTAFSDAQSAQFVSQYLARRTPAGWLSAGISPPITEAVESGQVTLGGHFRGFSEDLCTAWFAHRSKNTLAEGAVPDQPNLYRRANCGTSPDYEAITTVEQPDPAAVVNFRLQGFSQDHSHLLLNIPRKIHPDAPTFDPKGPASFLLYEQTSEGLRFVCYLPNGEPSPKLCSAGLPTDTTGDYTSKRNAISADGSRIYWTAYTLGTGLGSNPGTIYLRLGGQETVKVSSLVSPDPAFYWTAADDGSRAIFEFAKGPLTDQLYEFDLAKALAEEPGAVRLIAKGVDGPLGASEDASRLYFASTEDLDDGGPASAGAHNLYFYEADPEGGSGSFDFIMALDGADVSSNNNPSGFGGVANQPVHLLPFKRAAVVSPDGLHATFMSKASPTPSGYENLDLASGKAASEVYRYDAEAGDLRCISCNPTGARPAARVSEGILAAARIQGWELHHHAPRAISDDGSRVFFESQEALVPEDTNGTGDVYQWEEPGKGSCTQADPTYGEESGGCVDLISSGQSPQKSTFLDADPSGDNVFFGTLSSLVGSDYGLNDVYVARVGGGLPEPVRRAECEGEACQSPPAPPNDPTPASAGLQGEGNVREASPRKARRCGKGKRRVTRGGKARCVKKQRKQRRRAKSKTRRAGR